MISDLIRWEGVALLSSLFWGMVYAGIYDCIRIIRRIIRHRKVLLIFIEDIIFWIYVGINVFCITFQLNDGIIRGFSIAGYILGAVIYHFTLGRLFVKYVTKAILFILKPLKKAKQLIKIKLTKWIRKEKTKRVERRKKETLKRQEKVKEKKKLQEQKKQQKQKRVRKRQ